MTGLSDSHAEWLEARGLSIEVAAKHGLHSRGPAIAIPYVVDGKTLYVKTRDPRDKTLTRCHPAGVEQSHFWNADCLADPPPVEETLYICEGELDALALLQAGCQYVVSVPSGTQDNPSGARKKAEHVLIRRDDKGPLLDPRVARFKRIAVMADGDQAGIYMRDAIVDLIGKDYCWIPTYPQGSKDAGDVLRTDGVMGVQALIAGLQRAASDGYLDFISADETVSRIRSMNCGVPFLDKHFRPVRPSFIVVGGAAGSGKSTITQSLVFSLLWANPDLRASFFHAEGSKHIPVRRARLFWRNMTNPTQMDDTDKAQRDGWISERLAYISPPQDVMPTFQWVLWAMEQQALFRKRSVFVIDPWNQVVHDMPKGKLKTDYVGECIYQMKRMADRLGLIVIVAHHTTKEVDMSKAPGPYALADSAHWLNAADHLLMCWRPKADMNATQLEVVKSKDHEAMGKPGSVWIKLPSMKSQSTGIEMIVDFRLTQTLDPRPPQKTNGFAAAAEQPPTDLDMLM